LLAECAGRPFCAVGNGCILRRAGECGVSVGFEQRGFVGLWKPHLRAQNIAANDSGVCHVAVFEIRFFQR